MTWDDPDNVSIHHRDEGSEKNFDNALGGYLGDSRIMLRFLALNAGKGQGIRLFIGGGIAIPSSNTLTSDPFFLPDPSQAVPHRHFSMSDGVYKASFETQFFVKRMNNPVFIGGTISVELPVKDSQYGYSGSRLIDLTLTAFSKKINLIKGSFGGNIMIRNTNESYWNGYPAPNSKSTLVIPGFGVLWNLGATTMSVNLQKPIFINGAFSGSDGNANEKTETWQVSIGIRRVLDYYIPWLYW